MKPWNDWSTFYKAMFWWAYGCSGGFLIAGDVQPAAWWAAWGIAFAIAGWMPRKVK